MMAQIGPLWGGPFPYMYRLYVQWTLSIKNSITYQQARKLQSYPSLKLCQKMQKQPDTRKPQPGTLEWGRKGRWGATTVFSNLEVVSFGIRMLLNRLSQLDSRPSEKGQLVAQLLSLEWNYMEQARKPRNYAGSKLWPTTAVHWPNDWAA